MQKIPHQKMKTNLLYIVCFLPFLGLAQSFDFKAEIFEIEEKWQEINLEATVLSKIQSDFSDIRIYEIGEAKDILEVPYFIRSLENELTTKGVNFKLLNQVKKDGDLYLSFKTINNIEVNEISLNLNEENYNYKLDLQASNNQKEWFQVLEDYRILSIKNASTNYKFNEIRFANTQYKYYRIRIKNAEKTSLKSASIKQKINKPGVYEAFENEIKQEEKNKISYVTINLKNRVPVSQLQVFLVTEIDYYRALKIKYLVDSVPTGKGWHFNYASLSNSYLSSLEKTAFSFETVFTNKILLEIHNQDNQPLNIKKVALKGPKHQLIARYSGKNTNSYMLFGNTNIRKPQYDLLNFKENIPSNIKQAKLGKIEHLNAVQETNNFLNNKLWLWAILILIIAILAYSSLVMLKNKTV